MSCKEITRKEMELAQKILRFSRQRITNEAPFLLTAIYTLVDRVRETNGPISTDGTYLCYDPIQVIEDFRKEKESVAYQILHVTLHCLLGHLKERKEYADAELFDVAADFKTLCFANLVCPSMVRSRIGFLRKVLLHTDQPALARFYKNAAQSAKTRSEAIRDSLEYKAQSDDHRLWNPKAKHTFSALKSGAEDALSERAACAVCEDASGEQKAPNWNVVLKETFTCAERSAQWGDAVGFLKTELCIAPENRQSYRDFLKRFAKPKERLLLDPDSFDPKWYYLGLETYGDIPILEPSESSENPAATELVIAIDTSGSCSGEVCERFLRETLNLLRDISHGTDSFRVILMQCDTEIQKEQLFETYDGSEHTLDDFEPSGFGGTDFRPVFKRVEELKEEGVLTKVQGLVYLSDGYGDFPETEPDYPVAFLLLEDDFWGEPDIPDWVEQVRLNEEDFTLKEEVV